MYCLAQAALLQVLFIKFVPGVKYEEQGGRLSRTYLVSLSVITNVSFLFCVTAGIKQKSA